MDYTAKKNIYIAKPVGIDGVYKVGVSRNLVKRMIYLKFDYGCEFELLYDNDISDYCVESKVKAELKSLRSTIFGAHRTEVFTIEYEDLLSCVIANNQPTIHSDREIQRFLWGHTNVYNF